MDIDASWFQSPRGLDGELKALLEDLQSRARELAGQTYAAESDDGWIRAEATSSGQLRSVDIHVLAKRRYDNITLAETVLAVINAAQDRARQALTDLTNNVTVFGVPAASASDLARLQDAIQQTTGRSNRFPADPHG